MRRQDNVAAILRDFAFYQGEQAGFAAAVAPDQADAFAGRYGEVGLLEQQFAAALQGEVSVRS